MLVEHQIGTVPAGERFDPLRRAGRRDELDLFRFLAALTVMWFHYAFRGFAADGMTLMPFGPGWQVAKYGYLAVEFFFMISGYVILMSASGASPRRFAASRAARLYPAFWLCCTATFLCALVFRDPAYQVSFSQYIKNMTLFLDAFGVAPLDTAYWSLSYEIRFYFLVLVVLLCDRISKCSSYLFFWALTSTLLYLHPLGSFNYWFFPEYSCFFIAGCVFYSIQAGRLKALDVGTLFIAFAMCCRTSIARASWASSHFNTPFNKLVVIGIVAFFFLLFFLMLTGRTLRLGRPWFWILGAISYPLYLLHQHIGFMIFNRFYRVAPPLALSLAVGCLMIFVSWVVCRCFENRAQVWLRAFLEKLVAFL